jgi:hypothetical protein
VECRTIRSLWTGWEELNGDGLGCVDPPTYVLGIGMDDDAVDCTSNLSFIGLGGSCEDVVAVVKVETGVQRSGMKWRVVQDGVGSLAGGVGAEDELVEDMT